MAPRDARASALIFVLVALSLGRALGLSCPADCNPSRLLDECCLASGECAKTECHKVIKDFGGNEIECKKDSKDDQECWPCMTFEPQCGWGRGEWDSGCLGVVTCPDPDANGHCQWPGQPTKIKDGTLCVTTGRTKFNACPWYDLKQDYLNSGKASSAGCPDSSPSNNCNPNSMSDVCSVNSGQVRVEV